jgi:hypothetical protein
MLYRISEPAIHVMGISFKQYKFGLLPNKVANVTDCDQEIYWLISGIVV